MPAARLPPLSPFTHAPARPPRCSYLHTRSPPVVHRDLKSGNLASWAGAAVVDRCAARRLPPAVCTDHALSLPLPCAAGGRWAARQGCRCGAQARFKSLTIMGAAGGTPVLYRARALLPPPPLPRLAARAPADFNLSRPTSEASQTASTVVMTNPRCAGPAFCCSSSCNKRLICGLLRCRWGAQRLRRRCCRRSTAKAMAALAKPSNLPQVAGARGAGGPTGPAVGRRLFVWHGALGAGILAPALCRFKPLPGAFPLGAAAAAPRCTGDCGGLRAASRLGAACPALR